MTKITNDTFIEVEIDLLGNYSNADLDFGAVTLSLGEKEFIVDVVQTYRTFENGITTITCDVKIDEDNTCDVKIDEDNTWNDCKYDIEEEDLQNRDLKGCIYFVILDDESFPMDSDDMILSMVLWVKLGDCTKAINLTLD